MSNYITATEARRIANDIKHKPLISILKSIEQESKKGNFNICVDNTPPIFVIERLRDLGYEVLINMKVRNEYFTKINW